MNSWPPIIFSKTKSSRMSEQNVRLNWPPTFNPKMTVSLTFYFREKDQFQSAGTSSINLPHPLVTSSLGSLGGNPLGTSSSLHSLPQPFEPFQPFKKWFIGLYIHATYSKMVIPKSTDFLNSKIWFISNKTWRVTLMCNPLYMCLIVTLLNLETLLRSVS